MSILINTNPSPELDVPINVAAQLDTNTAGATFAWTLLDRPNPSTSAVISNPAIQNPTITPDCSGSYLVRLIIDGSTTEFGLFSVQTKRMKQRIPAAGEGDPALGGALADTESWATDVERFWRYIDDFYARGHLEICYNNSGGALVKGNTVFVSGVQTLDSGLPETQIIPAVQKASAASEATLGVLGLVLGKVGDLSSTVGSGELAIVVFGGLLTGVNTAGYSLNDLLYVSDSSGGYSDSEGTIYYEIGRVSKVNATEGAIEVCPGGGGVSDHNKLSTLQGGTADEYYHTTSAEHSILTSLDSTTPGSEGALNIGTDTKTNLSSAEDVEAALTELNARNPAKIATNAGNPEGVVVGTYGDVCLDTTNYFAYVKTTVSGNTGWKIVQEKFLYNLGVQTSDANALTFIQANKWDTNDDGTGDPRSGMFYILDTLGQLRMWNGTQWATLGPVAGTVNVHTDHMSGLSPEWTSVQSVTISRGECRDSTNVDNIKVITPIVVELDNGTGVNKLDIGLPFDDKYFVFVIKNPASRDVKGLISVSPTSPILPDGYTLFRRIGSFINYDEDIVEYLITANGNLRIYEYDTPQTLGTTSPITYTFGFADSGAYTNGLSASIFVPETAILQKVQFNLLTDSNGLAIRPTGTNRVTWGNVAGDYRDLELPVGTGQGIEVQSALLGSQGADVSITGYTDNVSVAAQTNWTPSATVLQLPRQYKDHINGMSVEWLTTDSVRLHPGECRSYDNTEDIVLETTRDIAFATGTNAPNGSDVTKANGWWFVHAIRRADNGQVDGFLSDSATAPVLPPNYTQFRQVSEINIRSLAIEKFVQEGLGIRRKYFYDDFKILVSGTDVIPASETVTQSISGGVHGNIYVAPTAKKQYLIARITEGVISSLHARPYNHPTYSRWTTSANPYDQQAQWVPVSATREVSAYTSASSPPGNGYVAIAGWASDLTTQTGVGVVSGTLEENVFDLLNLEWKTGNTVEISTGKCRSDDNICDIRLNSILPFDITTSGKNGLATSSTLTNGYWYKIYVMKNPGSGEVACIAFREDDVTMTLPAGFTRKRFVGSVKYESSAILEFKQEGEGSRKFYTFSTRHSVLTDGQAIVSTDVNCAAYAPSTADRVYIVVLGWNSTNSHWAAVFYKGAASGPYTPANSGAFTCFIPFDGTYIQYKNSSSGVKTRIWLNGYVEKV